MTNEKSVVALTRATALSMAFHWIQARRLRLPRTNVNRLIEFVVATFMLSVPEAEWLAWSLDPHSVSLAPKEPV